MTQHVLLALLGGALLRIAADGTFLRYVRPGHLPLLVAAGAVMLALAAVGVVRDLRSGRTGPEPDHDHGRAERFAPWLLLLPVLALAVASPQALGADAVARSETLPPAASPGPIALPPLPSDPVLELGLAEVVFRAVGDRSGTLDGREVVVTGFTVPRADGTDLARLTIMCCAADARVRRVRLDGLDGLPPDTWLRVQGRVQPVAPGERVATVRVTRADRVAQPRDPYEY